jgi:hypothetical protein
MRRITSTALKDSDRICIPMNIRGFWLTVHGPHFTVYGPYLQVVHSKLGFNQFPAEAVPFAL